MIRPAYTNPVYPRSFPDPFVLKFRAEYWAYCTGFWHDGRCFGVMRSADLVAWTPLAGALEPLAGSHPCYWAPEVVYHRGRFYLYYSVGNEERMEIRVAVADHPAGPFEDAGRRLTQEPFAIDAHVFAEPGGVRSGRWLFYATDFLDALRVGTGTVVDRMLDPFTLEGRPRPVATPRYDWHVYHPNRPEKGGVRWHTVEGPFVLARKGLYYEMFSGGNWQNPTYGVSYATAASLDDPGEWTQAADGEQVLPVLRSGGEVVGPGHNSVVRGPDNRQLWCIYHRWMSEGDDPGARVLAIDPLDWAGERLLVLGPTTGPRPAPLPPTLSRPVAAGETVDAGATSFLVEVSARALETPGPREGFGLQLTGEDGPALRLLLGAEARLSLRVREGWREERLALPAGFDPGVVHPLRLDLDGPRVSLSVDDVDLRWTGRLTRPASAVTLLAEGILTDLSGFALTVGWEELFQEEGDPERLGWQSLRAGGGARAAGGRLHTAGASLLARGPALRDYLLVVNARMEEDGEQGYEVHPALPGEGSGPAFRLTKTSDGWSLAWQDSTGEGHFPLPSAFDPRADQQLRFWKRQGRIELEWEGRPLGAVTAPPGRSRIGLGAYAPCSFEMVRVTAI